MTQEEPSLAGEICWPKKFYIRLIRVFDFRQIWAARWRHNSIQAQIQHHLAVVVGVVPNEGPYAGPNTRLGIATVFAIEATPKPCKYPQLPQIFKDPS
jgi:hypothetical protein